MQSLAENYRSVFVYNSIHMQELGREMTANACRLDVISDLVKELLESERQDLEKIKKRKQFIEKR